MAERLSNERRKNPSRKREMVFDIAYQVRWNDERRTFDVYREDERRGAFARDKATAVGLAMQAARQENGTLKVCVSSIQDGETIVEWTR